MAKNFKKNEKAEAYLQLVRENYRAYCYHVYNEGKDPSKDKLNWIPGKMHSFLCDEVQKFIETETGNPYDILLISCPPQHGKSKTITECLPSFYLGRNPENRVIEISYNDTFCKKFGRANKSKVEQFGHIFGIGVSKTTKSIVGWNLDNEKGGMISRGVLSGVTGEACNLMIIDDPIKNKEEADSKNHRDKIYGEWENSFMSRLAAGAKVIVIQTRWHEDDLYGRLQNDQFSRVINVPCEAEEDDILGREVGDALAPEIGKDKKWLVKFKSSYLSGKISVEGGSGSRAWNALYQGRPTAKEGNLLKREWWKYYNSGEVNFDHLIMGVDATFKDKDDSDFVAIEVWGKKDNAIFLVDVINERLGFLATMNNIVITKARYRDVTGILIEDKANGSAIIEVLRKSVMGIIAIEPRGGKFARASSVSDLVESGNVYLPRDKQFTGEFIDQCAEFPNGKNDDMVDCFSMCVERLRHYRGRKFINEKSTEQLLGFKSVKKERFGTGKGDDIVVI